MCGGIGGWGVRGGACGGLGPSVEAAECSDRSVNSDATCCPLIHPHKAATGRQEIQPNDSESCQPPRSETGREREGGGHRTLNMKQS